ncbi:hypothetical protein EON65_48285 [archaeon]|nr:MAG: hypothetical protein EON65_48285 [archaeon]
MKYSTNGTRVWTRLVETASNKWGTGVAVDSDGVVYVTGVVAGSLDGQSYMRGSDNKIVISYSSLDERLSTCQVGSAGDGRVRGLAVSSGSLSASGCASGSLRGEPYVTGWDISKSMDNPGW